MRQLGGGAPAPAAITPQNQSINNVGSAFATMPEGLTPEQQTAFKGVQSAFSVPSKNADGSVSSTDVTTGGATGSAMDAAGAALGQGTMPGWAKDVLNSNNQILASGQNALKLSFDASLAANNQQYASLFQELNGQHSTAKEAGAALAAQLNPYSDPRISSTTGGYLQSIDQKYETQAQKLQQQMNAAQQQLQAGYYKEYTAMINDAQKENNKFVMDMQQYQLSVFNSLKQDEQFKMNYDLSKETKATDDFRSYLTTLSGSPQLQADIATFNKTGKISPGLAPLIQRGVDAGMSPEEALNVFTYQTDSVRKQQALEDYRANQLINAQNRATNTQIKIATMQNISAVSTQLASQGILPGTIEYARSIAAASAGSGTALPYSAVTEWTNLSSFVGQLEGVKGRISAVNAGSALGNILLSKAPISVQSLSNSQLAQLNAEIGTMMGMAATSVFGEKGVPSDFDTQRILSGMPTGGSTAEVRNALYDRLVGFAADKAVNSLQNQAANGYNVVNYAPIAETLYSKASGLKGSTSGGNSFEYGGMKFTLPHSQ